MMFLIWSCGQRQQQTRDSHEGHDHSHEAVHESHSHEGHDHQAHDHEGHNHTASDNHGQAGHEAETENPDEIVISPEKASAAGIVTMTVEPGIFRDIIHTSGQILPAQGDEATVVATADGVVSLSSEYADGVAVSDSQELFSIASANLQDGDRISKARIAYETAKKEYERASKLTDSKIVSQKDFALIKENYENARLAYDALRPSKDGKGIAVLSPFRGFIKNIYVKDGDYVPVGTPLASVTQNRRLTLRADVSQRYYSRLRNISSANFKSPYDDNAYSTSKLGGRLLSVGKNAVGSSWYVPVSFSFENRGEIIPGSFVEVWLLAGERKDVISVPVSAITEEQGLYFVYLKLDDECYKKQEVFTGASDGERIEILKGLSAGDNVVVKGAYNVKLASASNAIPAHTHNH